MHCVKETAFSQQLEPLLGKAEVGMGGAGAVEGGGRGGSMLQWGLRAGSHDVM